MLSEMYPPLRRPLTDEELNRIIEIINRPCPNNLTPSGWNAIRSYLSGISAFRNTPVAVMTALETSIFKIQAEAADVFRRSRIGEKKTGDQTENYYKSLADHLTLVALELDKILSNSRLEEIVPVPIKDFSPEEISRLEKRTNHLQEILDGMEETVIAEAKEREAEQLQHALDTKIMLEDFAKKKSLETEQRLALVLRQAAREREKYGNRLNYK